MTDICQHQFRKGRNEIETSRISVRGSLNGRDDPLSEELNIAGDCHHYGGVGGG